MINNIHKLAIPLGYSIARCEVSEGALGRPYTNVRLYICTPSCTEEQTHAPAESVELYSLATLTELRDFLSKIIAIANKGVTAEPVVEAINQAAIDQTHEPKP